MVSVTISDQHSTATLKIFGNYFSLFSNEEQIKKMDAKVLEVERKCESNNLFKSFVNLALSLKGCRKFKLGI